MKIAKRRKIYKLESSFLRKARWKLDMPLEKAIKEYPEIIVTLGDSQLMRWLDALNGIEDSEAEINRIKLEIAFEKGKKPTTKTRRKIKELYKELYSLQFQKDYVCVIMESNDDYDRCNKGFSINGINYRRLYGTSNGVKQRTIVYINAAFYDDIKRKIDNGRNKDIPLVPGKLEAYQALTASGSVPLPEPNGIIVVKDCITKFKENVIVISDAGYGEPKLTHKKNYEIEHNDSDGYGLMLPTYSAKVNKLLNGDYSPIAGMNTRYAFEKGMLFTFDFIKFAENVAGTYEITDVWGTKRDVRDAEVILTASQLKLWECYSSWEDYHANCVANGYQFSTPKTTPSKLENVRELNYQFINPYTFTDEDLEELCEPTVKTIKDVLGGDFRKGIVYLSGSNLSEKNVLKVDDYLLALMIAPEAIQDPYVINTIYHNIQKKIDNCKKGTINVNGSYLIVSGDPYALAQSIFNLPITGILSAGEIYQKYWIDKGASELVCFRAPMTCYNNIRKMRLNKSTEAAHWYKYIDTALIYNAWDSACDALNGMDKDGDTNLITDNPVLLRNTTNAKTIFCIQKKAPKKIVAEEDLIESNKIAFNDDIGKITNRITSMLDLRTCFDKDSEEYKILSYRIMCGQHYQQCSIDRVKGVISMPMPKDWYTNVKRKKKTDDEEDDEENTVPEIYNSLIASKKPYFLIYRYPELRKEYNKYIKNCNANALRRFMMTIDELYRQENPTEEMKTFLYYFEKGVNVSNHNCTVNRIARLIERKFANPKEAKNPNFDYSIYKSGVGYPLQTYSKVKALYDDYKERIAKFQKQAKKTALDKDSADIARQDMIDYFVMRCAEVCPDDNMLCDIVVDLCYIHENSKSFAWDMCGHTIVKNLLEKHGHTITFPMICDEKGDFEYMGNNYRMERMILQ